MRSIFKKPENMEKFTTSEILIATLALMEVTTFLIVLNYIKTPFYEYPESRSM